MTVRDLIEILRNHGLVEQRMDLLNDGTKIDAGVEECLGLLQGAYGIGPLYEVVEAELGF
jgi:hypothetical protein